MFLNDYLRQEFGEKLYKLSFELGASCPNRDGSKGIGGCYFCSEGGSGDFAVRLNEKTIDEQIDLAKEKVSNKFNGDKYIAYFQSHTNTYFTDKFTREYFEKILDEMVKREEIAVISIATRADCIDESLVRKLASINVIKPVWVEIGLQTIHDKSRVAMNCCFTLEDFEKSFELLEKFGIKTIVHMIAGLPEETDEDILETAEYIAKIKPFGIKIQLLHVLKNTKLADIYNSVHFRIFSMEEYTDLVVKILKMMPEDVIVHRMTGDGPADLLIEPGWSTDKKRVLNMINSKMKKSIN